MSSNAGESSLSVTYSLIWHISSYVVACVWCQTWLVTQGPQVIGKYCSRKQTKVSVFASSSKTIAVRSPDVELQTPNKGKIQLCSRPERLPPRTHQHKHKYILLSESDELACMAQKLYLVAEAVIHALLDVGVYVFIPNNFIPNPLMHVGCILSTRLNKRKKLIMNETGKNENAFILTVAAVTFLIPLFDQK